MYQYHIDAWKWIKWWYIYLSIEIIEDICYKSWKHTEKQFHLFFSIHILTFYLIRDIISIIIIQFIPRSTNKIVPIIPPKVLSFSQKWVSFQPGISFANYTDPILTYFLNKLAHSLWGNLAIRCFSFVTA